MKKVNITKNTKLLLLGAATLLFSTTQAQAQTQNNGCTNSGTFASAIGESTNATGSYSFSSGRITTASGYTSTALGYNSLASGSYSTGIGVNNVVRGSRSIAIGFVAETGISNSAGIAIGVNVLCNANRSFILGTGYLEKGGGAPVTLVNNFEHSLMIGFRSNLPSLFVGPSAGPGTTGRVAIGTTNTPTTIGGQNISAYRLFVKGGILADEVRVRTGWADYVFADEYKLPTLAEVGAFIDENGHLPNVPSAAQVEEEGIEIGEITRIQQEKIEELTLYLIEIQKELELMKIRLDEQEK
ncbi:MAG: hypothetical protein ACI8ZM_003538 [Crocinitomix sp.]|jgi:hypothetical protein